MLAGDYPHPVAMAESEGGRHTLRPAMRRLSDNELEVVFKSGWKPSEYLASRDG